MKKNKMLIKIIYNLLIYIITIIPLLIAVAYFTLIELHVLAAIQRRQVGFSAIFKISEYKFKNDIRYNKNNKNLMLNGAILPTTTGDVITTSSDNNFMLYLGMAGISLFALFLAANNKDSIIEVTSKISNDCIGYIRPNFNTFSIKIEGIVSIVKIKICNSNIFVYTPESLLGKIALYIHDHQSGVMIFKVVGVFALLNCMPGIRVNILDCSSSIREALIERKVEQSRLAQRKADLANSHAWRDAHFPLNKYQRTYMASKDIFIIEKILSFKQDYNMLFDRVFIEDDSFNILDLYENFELFLEFSGDKTPMEAIFVKNKFSLENFTWVQTEIKQKFVSYSGYNTEEKQKIFVFMKIVNKEMLNLAFGENNFNKYILPDLSDIFAKYGEEEEVYETIQQYTGLIFNKNQTYKEQNELFLNFIKESPQNRYDGMATYSNLQNYRSLRS